MRIISVKIFILLWFYPAAQEYSLKGRVIDSLGHHVPNASIVFKKQGGAEIKTFSDSRGHFTIGLPFNGTLEIGAVGFKSFLIPVQLKDKGITDLGTIRLLHKESTMSAVRVTANRPALLLESDKKTLNVDNIISAKGSSALDLLEQIPGVYVNRTGPSVEIDGKSGVSLYINGKPTFLSAQELVQYLQQLNGNALSGIEVIDKPSAKHEAQGNAGVINLILKKTTTQTNGSIYFGGGVGRFGKWNSGFRLGSTIAKNVKINVSYDLNHTKNYTDAFYTRKVQQIQIDQDYFLINRDWSHQLRAAVEIPLNNRSSLTVEGRSALARNLAHLHTETFFSQTTGSPVDSIAYQTNKYPTTRNHHNVTVSYSLPLDSSGQSINISGGWIEFYNRQQDAIANRFVNAQSGNEIRPPLYLTGTTPIRVTTKALQVDYEKQVTKNGKLEAGLRYNNADIGSNVVFASGPQGNLQHDRRFSATLRYNESVKAAYLNTVFTANQLTITTGIRAEHFVAKGSSSKSVDINRNVVQLFPNLNAGLRLPNQHKVNLLLNRRINRPSFQSLNPAINFVSYYSTYQGNPLLQPAISNNASLVYQLLKPVQLQLNYSRIKNPITYSFVQNDQNRVSEVSQFNFESQQNIWLLVTGSFSPTKWWRTSASLNTFHNDFNYGNFSNSQWSFASQLRNTFTLPGSMSAELGISYRAPSVYGYLREESFTNVTAGIQKDFKKVNVSVSGRDIFKTLKYNNRVRFDNNDIGNFTRFETQVFNLTLTYKFLQGKSPSMKINRTFEEEERRIQG